MSVLPGVRDFRVPLAAGILWLVGLWIAVEPQLRGQLQDNPIVESLSRLYGVAGHAGLAASSLFVAYLIGLLLPFHAIPIHRVLVRAGLEGLALDSPTRSDLRRFIRPVANEALRAVPRPDLKTMSGAKLGPRRSLEDMFFVDRLVQDILAEESTLAVRLRIQEKERLFQSYDRHLAEAEFRQALVLPLAWLIGMAASYSTLWLWAELAPVVLFSLAMVKRRAATSELCQALIAGEISSTALTDFEETLANGDEEQLSRLLFRSR